MDADMILKTTCVQKQFTAMNAHVTSMLRMSGQMIVTILHTGKTFRANVTLEITGTCMTHHVPAQLMGVDERVRAQLTFVRPV